MPRLEDINEFAGAIEAHRRLLICALNVLTAEMGDEGDAHYDAQMEYAQDELALAARALVRATEQLPADIRPVGWNKT